LLKETKRGRAIDRPAVTELERFDGKFVVHSNEDTLARTAESLARYTLSCVKTDF
jgi:hypothetical protein